MRPPSPSIPEKEFFAAALREGLRLDGRGALEMRTPTFTFGPELGFVEVALGKTRVLAHVEAKMIKPAPERPYEGVISIHAELSPMASSEYEPGRPSEEEVSIVRMLDKVLRRSDAVDKESLCIQAGQRVWHLRLTVHALADAGNLLDCTCLAGLLALRHFRRPEVEVIGSEVTVHPATSRAPLPLAINHSPFCLTFALFPRATVPGPAPAPGQEPPPVFLLDPSPLERALARGTLAVALNAQRELCVLHKAGGVPLAPAEVTGVVNVAVGVVKDLDRRVKEALEKDWEGRRKAVEVS